MTKTYEHGTFCWADLATPDLAGAKAFYAALFGWRMHDVPIGDGMIYSTAYIGDDDVCAIFTMPDSGHSWMPYLAVTSADDAAKRVKVLGGTIIREPHEVLDAGRMALIEDPSGAVVALWEGRSHPGANRMRANGAMTWFELHTEKRVEATSFYRGMFGWHAKVSPGYTEWQKNGVALGGMMELMEQAKANGAPPHWLIYFQVADVDAKTEQAQKLGARALIGPADIGTTGRFAVLQDPVGAIVALYGPHPSQLAGGTP